MFRYHPDPVGTESAAPTDARCGLCSEPATLRYLGPIYGRYVDVLCLRCIANGTAARRLSLPNGSPAEFTDVGVGVSGDVPPEVLEEVSQRTPGFVGWQQERWMYHCSDAAAYLGRVGWEEVKDLPDAVASLRAEAFDLGVKAAQADEQVRWLSRTGDFTGHLFRCLHCAAHLAYSDAN
jgi:uncharacterized protein